jgi:Ni/Fe-hydrogenase subunit HybB-like protein
MKETWQRDVPVFDVPIWTTPFKVLCSLGGLALLLVTYREFEGLGPVSGMNDAYAWGIWKTFNTMVLTGLGSGAFAVGIAAWLFRRNNLHVVMRTAVLTSFLAYASGLTMLGIDVGRPWNFYWIFCPWRWNYHSPLLEVAFCMPVYAMLPLLMENFTPALDWFHEHRPEWRPVVERAQKIIVAGYPWIVGLAYVLPAMHQSSLGALMLLGGTRVHPLWQTPLLPLLYVWAAAFMGFSCVAGTLLFCGLMWDRPFDLDILGEMNRITAWLIGSWLVLRLGDVIVRGKLPLAFQPTIYAGLFWTETLFLGVALWMLRDSSMKRSPRLMFHAQVIAAVGGMLYRFDPTTLAFQPRPGAFYFPSAIELFVSLGFVSLAIAAFMFLVKVLAILPAPTRLWYAMEAQQWKKLKSFPDGAARANRFATGD